MPLAKARRLVPPLPPSSPPLLYAYYCPIYRPFLLHLSDCLIVSLFFSPLARWSTKLARDPRRPLSAGLLPPGPLVVSGPELFCPVSPGRAMRYLWVSFGALCRSRHYTKESKREQERSLPSTPPTLSLPPGMDTGSKCSSQGRDVKPQPPPPTTTMMVAAVATTTTATATAVVTRTMRSYECSASGIVFLCLPFFLVKDDVCAPLA